MITAMRRLIKITFPASIDKGTCSMTALNKRKNNFNLIEEGDGEGLLEGRVGIEYHQRGQHVPHTPVDRGWWRLVVDMGARWPMKGRVHGKGGWMMVDLTSKFSLKKKREREININKRIKNKKRQRWSLCWVRGENVERNPLAEKSWFFYYRARPYCFIIISNLRNGIGYVSWDSDLNTWGKGVMKSRKLVTPISRTPRPILCWPYISQPTMILQPILTLLDDHRRSYNSHSFEEHFF